MTQTVSLPPASVWPRLAATLELLKPLTWFAPMWAYGCGIVSAGQAGGAHIGAAVAGIVLAGPMVCGTSQAVNDWFDRHVDAINEPGRPVPSGRIPGTWGLRIAIIWTALSLALAISIGPWVGLAGLVGLSLAWAYSAPPLRLKQNGWWGNAAVGLCYETLPWFTAAAAVSGAVPDPRVVSIALLYGVGAHGIMTLNDFKSVAGDTELGLRSLPVQLGVNNAARLACVVMAAPQIVVIALLAQWGRPVHAAVVGVLLLAQGALMTRLIASPRERAAWYNATGTTLYVLGMLAAAFAIRSLLPELAS